MSWKQLPSEVNNILLLWHHFGPGSLAFRLSYASRRRTGLLRRQLPARFADWDIVPNPFACPTVPSGASRVRRHYRMATEDSYSLGWR
jgi:hypothetical protein